MDKEYNGKWPDTTNHGKYPKEEFESTFNNSYSYAISTINDFCYTDEQREESLKSRRLSKNVNICIINDIKRKYKKIKLKDLLEECNKILIESGHKKISLSSLKRHLKELKNMSEDGIKELYEDVEYTIKEREQDLLDALESSDENSKKVKNCKKRLKQVKVKIKEEI
jgi:DNA replication initiation complex subunit (GINS family)